MMSFYFHYDGVHALHYFPVFLYMFFFFPSRRRPPPSSPPPAHRPRSVDTVKKCHNQECLGRRRSCNGHSWDKHTVQIQHLTREAPVMVPLHLVVTVCLMMVTMFIFIWSLFICSDVVGQIGQKVPSLQRIGKPAVKVTLEQ